MLRSPVVAGRFYPARPEILREDLARYTRPASEPIAAIGCVVPHAGYMYSGPVAGALYGALDLPSSFVILCPNHTGRGAPQAMSAATEWLTPLGRAPLDAELAALIRRECPGVADDETAHAQEHALEVQLPFLQYRLSEFRFVPIALGSVGPPELEQLGEGLARAIRACGRRVLVIASSDMNHYEPDSTTREKDRRAIAEILKLDAAGLYAILRRDGNTMCGYGPAIAMLSAAKRLGADRAGLVRYATSADAGGPRDSVVGYAAIAVWSTEQAPAT